MDEYPTADRPGADYKLLFAGPMGAGKTTAIGAISEIPPISTEAHNLDKAQHSKATTTVGLDYGEVALPDGARLKLYGLPGQGRFDFMWKLLAEGAIGVVLLMDNTRSDPIAELDTYVNAFKPLAHQSRMVIGVGRTNEGSTRIADYGQHLHTHHQLRLPVFSIDARKREDVLLLLDALVQQIETQGMTA